LRLPSGKLSMPAQVTAGNCAGRPLKRLRLNGQNARRREGTEGQSATSTHLRKGGWTRAPGLHHVGQQLNAYVRLSGVTEEKPTIKATTTAAGPKLAD